MSDPTPGAAAEQPGDGGRPRRAHLRSTLVLAVIALALTAPATIALARADDGLVRGAAVVGGVPVTTLDADPSTASPAVVVVHGFAGSAMLMDDLGVSLARSGYAVVLPDLAGHGRNSDPLPLVDGRTGTDRLDADLAAVVAWTRDQPWADPSRLGLLGHSMGAGAVVRAAVADAEGPGGEPLLATVALSLPSADDVPVGPADVPRNLLLLYGANEQPRFVDAALGALRAAYPDGVVGPGYGAPVDGTARSAEEVPRADHITILFAQDTRQLALDWLDQTVGAPSSGSTAGGSRIGWLLLLTVGAAIGFVPLARLVLPEREAPMRPAPSPRAWVVLAISAGSAVAASLVSALLQGLTSRVPLAVGGYVLGWFAVAGLVAAGLASLRDRRRGGAPRLAQAGGWREILVVLGLTAYAVVALGLVARSTWTAFELVGDRPRWLLPVELALIAWFWADDRLVGTRWWLGALTRVVAVLVLLASVLVLGAPGFLTLLVPLMGVVLALLLVYGQTVTRRATVPWSPALVQAIPLAYLVATTFPLVSV